jgi:hypothetical protein
MQPVEPLAMWRTRTKQKSRRKDLSDEKIREIARKHFAEDFPNPKRQGCPPKSAIRLLADDPQNADDYALNHISFCSPCYRDFSRFLQAIKKKRYGKCR